MNKNVPKVRAINALFRELFFFLNILFSIKNIDIVPAAVFEGFP
jgi:hypothetical protein